MSAADSWIASGKRDPKKRPRRSCSICSDEALAKELRKVFEYVAGLPAVDRREYTYDRITDEFVFGEMNRNTSYQTVRRHRIQCLADLGPWK